MVKIWKQAASLHCLRYVAYVTCNVNIMRFSVVCLFCTFCNTHFFCVIGKISFYLTCGSHGVQDLFFFLKHLIFYSPTISFHQLITLLKWLCMFFCSKKKSRAIWNTVTYLWTLRTLWKPRVLTRVSRRTSLWLCVSMHSVVTLTSSGKVIARGRKTLRTRRNRIDTNERRRKRTRIQLWVLVCLSKVIFVTCCENDNELWINYDLVLPNLF